jgi:hypothetical protein
MKWVGPAVLLFVILFAIAYAQNWPIFPLLGFIVIVVVMIAIGLTLWAEVRAQKEKGQ